MGSLETQCLAQGSTVGPAPALVTQAPIILMVTHAMLTTPLTKSSVTANQATPVSYHTIEIYSAAFLISVDHFLLLCRSTDLANLFTCIYG